MYKVKRVRGCKEEIRKGSYRIAKRNRCNNACLVPSSHAVINCALAVTIHIVESSREWREESGEWRVERELTTKRGSYDARKIKIIIIRKFRMKEGRRWRKKRAVVCFFCII